MNKTNDNKTRLGRNLIIILKTNGTFSDFHLQYDCLRRNRIKADVRIDKNFPQRATS